MLQTLERRRKYIGAILSDKHTRKKHFEAKYYRKGNAVIQSTSASHKTSPVSILRKSPRKRVYQEEQFETFLVHDSIKEFSDINANVSARILV